MTKLDRVLLTIATIATIASMYVITANKEVAAEQRATLDSLQQQLTTISEQVQEQEKYLSTVTDFIPSDRIVVHGSI